MTEAIDIHGTAFKNGSITLLARVVDGNGDNVVPAEVSAVGYTVYLLNDRDADDRIAIDGHAEVNLSVAEVVFAALQTDSLWTVDAVGYNFRHSLDVSAHQAFAIAGRRYLVEYRLTPAVGQVILARFRINVI